MAAFASATLGQSSVTFTARNRGHLKRTAGELIRATDALAGKAQRSAFVERAVRQYLHAILRRARHEHDLQAIAAQAEGTNRESDQLLELQAWPE